MGQGYSLTSLSAGSASIDIPELADLVHESTLGAARFMKSIRARNKQGLVFVKAFVKPYASFGLDQYAQAVLKERDVLNDIPNTLAQQRVLETSNGGFLVRQYMNSSLYDRISTRPFLEDIEKKWLAFQLLCAVRDCHSHDLFHGDIKTENVLVTSWNWLYLADFSSSFKPSYLPEDNPADFSFYFDTSGRRTCYLAPERFVGPGESPSETGINWAMDIFSAGCVIAELFLEGPVFTLSQLFRYRKGELSLEHTHLSKIKDDDVRELILHMVGLEPESRYPAEEILTFWRGKVFPEYFYGFLHQYMALLTDFSSGRKEVSFEGNAHEADERIERIYADFDKIAYFLGYITQDDDKKVSSIDSTARALPLHIDIDRGLSTDPPHPINDDKGTLVFLGVVMASLRNTSEATARIKACDLLLAFAQRLPDEIKLDRILPYTVTLLVDQCDMVRIAGLTTMTQILASVHVVSPVNAYIFPEYIFPKLRSFITVSEHEPSPIIRASYAGLLGSLAQSSTRILDMMQAIKADGGLPELAENDWTLEATFHGLFDVARADLFLHFEEATKSLIEDPEPEVRRAFLGSVSSLCVFFGNAKASDVILSHLNTYLNDNDWILKCSFIKVLVGVATFVGAVNLEKFILPLMIQSLTDPEAFVVERVIRSLASIAKVGLFQRPTLWDILSIVVRFLVHPSLWIREASAEYIQSCCSRISSADKYCIVLPLLQPFLRTPILETTEYQVLDALKKPLPRQVLEMAIFWATKVEKGIFWKNATHDAVFFSPDETTKNRAIPSGRQFPTKIPSTQKNEEDDQWLAKLRGIGMQNEDDFKLLALREFIWRVAHRKTDKPDMKFLGTLNNVVSLVQVKATPQTVFFDNQNPVRVIENTVEGRQDQVHQAGRIHTIADALLDASASLENPLAKRGSVAREVPTKTGQPKPKSFRKPGDACDEVSHTPSYSSSANNEPGANERRRLPERTDSDNSLQLRPKAITLLNRNDGSKAGAATSTISENAFAKLDGTLQPHQQARPSPLSIASRAPESPVAKSSRKPADLAFEANHSYAGQDKNILRLLDNHFLENFPTDLLDFGQLKRETDPGARIPKVSDPVIPPGINKVPEKTAHISDAWHPTGQLLAIFSEHTAAVNRVVPAPDDAFFVTASDDGCCKIWDTSRLERNVTPRSRQTYKHPARTKIKAIAFIENTHALVVGAEDGSIHIIKVDYKKTQGGESTRYGKLHLIRDYKIEQTPISDSNPARDQPRHSHPEHAIWLYHYRIPNSQSILLILTDRSRILALDMKTMDVLYTFQNPHSHGSCTTFVVDIKRNWLLLGTSHGIFDLWDLRFRLRIRSWGLKSGNRIRRLALSPIKKKDKWVVVAAGPEISVWDIEKLVCLEVYRTDSTSSSGPGSGTGTPRDTTTPISRAAPIASTKPYEPWFPDDEPAQKLFARFADQVGENGHLTDPAQTSPYPQQPPSDPPLNSDVTALYVGYDITTNSSSSPNGERAPFVVSGGSDCKLRFWNLDKPHLSSVISGIQPSADDGYVVPKPHYDITHPGGQITLVTETIPSSASKNAAAPTAAAAQKRGRDRASRGSSGGGGGQSSASGGAGSTKPPRSTIISNHQQTLLRNHLDEITDCCVLTKPYGVVVSVDRSGGVYVYQ